MTSNFRSATFIDPKTRAARRGDRAATKPPGVTGNRWMTFGANGAIPKQLRPKLEKACGLVYELRKRKKFLVSFEKILKTYKLDSKAFVDVLDGIEINLADTCTIREVREEVSSSKKIWKEVGKPTEGGFTIPIFSKAGQQMVFIYKFALRDWNSKFLAGLIMHEATHVAGAPVDDFSELYLSGLGIDGYFHSPTDD